MEGRKGGFRPRGGMNITPPIKVGEEKEVTIEAVGEKGDGLAKINGFVLFVPNVKEGQRVKIRVTKVLRKVGFAEVIGDAESAPEKQEAPTETEDFGEQAEESQDSGEFGDSNETEGSEDSEDFGEQ